MTQAINQILVVQASPRGQDSASRAVTARLLAQLGALHPEARLLLRDLGAAALPHLDELTVRAVASHDAVEAAELKEAARLSDELTDEVLASDLLVIATPMWNFGVPSALKAWIDLIVRAGKTFHFTSAGVEGLAKNKRAILVLASGGVFSSGPWTAYDFLAPYLKHILWFIGIVDVQVVRVEGTSIPHLASLALPNAEKALEALAI